MPVDEQILRSVMPILARRRMPLLVHAELPGNLAHTPPTRQLSRIRSDAAA